MAEGKALQLSTQVVGRIVRLLSDAFTPDDGRAAKVARLCNGLCGMVDADGWLFFRSRMDPDGGPPANIDYFYGGAFDEKSLAEYADYSLEVKGEQPEFPRLKPLIAAGAHVTRRHQELVDMAEWRSGRYDGHIERIGFDAFMYSTVPLMERDGAPICSTALLFRKPGRPEFDERDARLVHLVISECGVLHRDGLDIAQVDDVGELTPRQRSVLVMLMDGLSQKQVAQRLGIGHHTVGDHMKAIYRHFDVESRAELMRRFIQRAGR